MQQVCRVVEQACQAVQQAQQLLTQGASPNPADHAETAALTTPAGPTISGSAQLGGEVGGNPSTSQRVGGQERAGKVNAALIRKQKSLAFRWKRERNPAMQHKRMKILPSVTSEGTLAPPAPEKNRGGSGTAGRCRDAGRRGWVAQENAPAAGFLLRRTRGTLSRGARMRAAVLFGMSVALCSVCSQLVSCDWARLLTSFVRCCLGGFGLTCRLPV